MSFTIHVLQLTAAISASPGVIREGLDVPVMAKYMDAIHIMAYDYHGSWEKKADHHAALYPRSWDRDLNCDSTVKTLMQLGTLTEHGMENMSL